ncbi:MAG: lamin tail domain-containing protein, partial [Bacteroidales bacterium]|nr:lamin tail domain-containing protein [Bacteroidales bacterium]
MLKVLVLSLLFVLLSFHLFSQKDTVTVMYYNILSFPDGDPGRENYFETINNYLESDVILVNEMMSNYGASLLLDQALNVNGINYYQKAVFTNGPDSDNMLFYNSDKFTLYSQHYIVTSLRHINEYVLYFNSSNLAKGDTIFLYLYSAHLKAGSDPVNEQQRQAEVNLFKNRINAIANAENIFFGGDLNLYYSGEPAYNTLINSGNYPLNDPLPAGNWHSSYTYRYYHTQSTRTSVFGGGANGGLDDRFDFILFSDDVNNGTNGVKYLPNTCKAFGNDGNHFNDALINPPVNPNLPANIIQALYYMSDHLPVVCQLEIEAETGSTVNEQLIISEIMQNPEAVIDSDGEWFEVFNPTDDDINLNGWYLKDMDYDSHQISGNVIVPSKGFVVLGIEMNVAANGNYTCDYQYDGFYMSNGEDEIILTLPDGNTVIDQVEYDGGPNWPDPAGASMIFTGGPEENNNDFQFWVTSSVREPSFIGLTGDKGSPGTNGQGQNLSLSGFNLNLKVFLEGPFQNTLMNTDINNQLPLNQPFNSPPWNYQGAESVQAIPFPDIVDWILIELRDTTSAEVALPSSMIDRKAAFLKNDGVVVDIDGVSQLSFNFAVEDSLFLVVMHRNHLSVLSASGLTLQTGIYSYDFSTASEQAYGGILGHKQVSPGIWAMTGGDGDANGQVNNGDKNDVWAAQAG